MRFLDWGDTTFVSIHDLMDELTSWERQVVEAGAPEWPIANFIAHILHAEITRDPDK